MLDVALKFEIRPWIKYIASNSEAATLQKEKTHKIPSFPQLSLQRNCSTLTNRPWYNICYAPIL